MAVGRLFVCIILAFAVIATFLVVSSTIHTSSAVVIPSTLAKDNTDHTRIRVGGRVTNDEIVYQTSPTIKLSFSIMDPGSDGSVKIPVVYEQLKPDMFASGRDVLVDGDFKNGVLQANTLLTQCPSKYEPPKPSQENVKKD